MNEHVAAEVLAAYVDGTLPSETRPGVEAHLCRCRECRQALVEIGEIRSCRTEVPQEFLQRALDDAGGNRRQMDAVANRNVMPMRLAFGVAAVFLVALAIGYLFIGRERGDISEIAQKRIVEPAMVAEEKPASVEPDLSARGAANPARAQAPTEAPSGLEAEKKTASGEPAPGVAPAALPVTSTASTDMALKQERLRVADEMATMPLREEEGGVIGGVEAPVDKDNFAAAKLTAPAPVRDKGSLPRKAEAQLRRFSGSAMAGDAMQLFLAATGRAAAPRMLRAEKALLRLPVRIEGDVAEEDLLDPWPLDAWAWLPAGSALEVTIAADGSVRAVALLGRWETGAAARAKAAAGKLAFTASARETRRAVLSRDPLN